MISVTKRQLTQRLELEAAQAALDFCTAAKVTAHVVIADAKGAMRLLLIADGGRNDTLDGARRKAYTAAQMGQPTATIAERLAANPKMQTPPDAMMLFLPGGIPIRAGSELIGSIAVGGAAPEQDAKCAQAGLDKIQYALQPANPTAQQVPTPAAATPILVRNGPPWDAVEPRLFTSGKELEEHLVKADASVKAGKAYNGGPLLMQGSHRIQLEWRNAAQLNTNLHETDAEMFVVVEGSGTMTLGGTLLNPRRTLGNAWEGPTQIGTGATGGVPYKVSKGDMIMIPENTAHTVSEVNGKLVLWALHLPRPTPRPAVEPAWATATITPAR
jgi:uncharacterized protein GlcG (DUF336 family)/mannose-6-phosphate isomerase-like protein (cupin superfamily)